MIICKCFRHKKKLYCTLKQCCAIKLYLFTKEKYYFISIVNG